MYLIAGLGNPGKDYDGTRHNAGFEVLDLIIDKHNIDGPTSKFQALLGRGVIDGNKVIAAKPMTYMNLSGDAIRKIVEYYDIDRESELIVINDDIDLPVGVIRIRRSGSAGGHNGLKSIIKNLGTQNFIRVRVGVGDSSDHAELIKHVLGKIKGDEKELYEQAKKNAAEAVELIINSGVDAAMNKFNTHGGSDV